MGVKKGDARIRLEFPDIIVPTITETPEEAR